MILLSCFLTLFYQWHVFSHSYQSSSGRLLFLSNVKYTINTAIVIITYQTLYNMYKKIEVKLVLLCNGIEILN